MRPTCIGVLLLAAVATISCGAGPSTPTPPASGTFFESTGARLSYRVDRPSGTGPFRAVVMGHERGPATKDHYATLAAELTGAGYLVLRYDKRGVGQSTGTFEDITVANSDRVVNLLAGDLVAAVQTLKQQPDVIANGIGLVGASEAGWSLPLAASMSADVRFVAAIVSPAVPVGTRNRFAELAANPATGLDALSSMLASFGGPFGYDPRPAIDAMSVPALWILALDDRIVPTRESAAVITQAGTKPSPLTLVVLPGDHEMRNTTAFVPTLLTWMAGIR